MLDYFTLIGDSIDNVPGVPVRGSKTAVKWLAEYGSLDGVIEHAGEIAGVVGENLRKSLDWLPQGKILTVKCDVELPVKPEDLRLGARRRAPCRALLALRLQELVEGSAERRRVEREGATAGRRGRHSRFSPHPAGGAKLLRHHPDGA